MDDNEWHEVTRKKSNSVFQRLRFPSSVSNRYPSKEDQAQKIPKSVFVTNFPNHFSARDLWNVCVAYGKVIDVFIQFKRSKTGKKFAFVRFIRVDNMERLIENLSTIWIGKFRLHANVVRFQRDPKPTDSQTKINVPYPNKSFEAPVKNIGTDQRSFASVLNVGNGFENVKISHLGGLWVLLNMDSVVAKEKVRNYVGVGSWFSGLQPASDSFVCDERITWISIKENPSKLAAPFNIYSLLKKNKEEVVMENNMHNVTSDKSDPQFPPGFTPDVEKNNEEEVNPAKEVLPKDKGVAYDVNESIGVSSIKSGGLGQKAKKGWIQELNSKHRVSYLLLYKRTKMGGGGLLISLLFQAALGGMGTSLCIIFKGLWEFLGHLIDTWDGECVLLGDFNEVRSINERFGTLFNSAHGAISFNDHSISLASSRPLVDLPRW
ncbi:RNA-directed DNA polymerase, eukaryota [Tanacetum coccineum]